METKFGIERLLNQLTEYKQLPKWESFGVIVTPNTSRRHGNSGSSGWLGKLAQVQCQNWFGKARCISSARRWKLYPLVFLFLLILPRFQANKLSRSLEKRFVLYVQLGEAANIVLLCAGRWRKRPGIVGALLGVTRWVTRSGCRRLRAAGSRV